METSLPPPPSLSLSARASLSAGSCLSATSSPSPVAHKPDSPCARSATRALRTLSVATLSAALLFLGWTCSLTASQGSLQAPLGSRHSSLASQTSSSSFQFERSTSEPLVLTSGPASLTYNSEAADRKRPTPDTSASSDAFSASSASASVTNSASTPLSRAEPEVAPLMPSAWDSMSDLSSSMTATPAVASDAVRQAMESASSRTQLDVEAGVVDAMISVDGLDDAAHAGLDSLRGIGAQFEGSPEVPPWMDEWMARAEAEQRKAMAFYESKATAAVMGLAHESTLGDLEDGGLPVDWEQFWIEGSGGVQLKAVVAFPAAPGTNTAGLFPVVILANSWLMNWWEYALKQEEWASRGYVVLMYVARGWWESGGTISAAGAAELADCGKVVDTVFSRASTWGADTGKIAMAGVSYGGGLGALCAAHDTRVGAVVSMSAWGSILRALAGQGAPNQVWFEILKLGGSIMLGMGDIDADVAPQFRQILRGNMSGAVVDWARKRSPEFYANNLCGGGRRMPVFLSNNADDRLFRPDATLIYRQILHGAGCNVFTMISEGMHAQSELPSMLGLTDTGLGSQNPVWHKALAFLDLHLKHSENSPMAEQMGHVDFQMRDGQGYMKAPKYITFATWPSDRVKSTKLALVKIGDELRLAQQGPPLRAREEDGDQLHMQWRDAAAASRRGCSRTLAFGWRSGFSGGIPLVASFMQAGAGIAITSRVADINRTAAALYTTDPLPAPLRLCGIPNISLALQANSNTFQVVAFLFDVDPDQGALTVMAVSARNVWHIGENKPFAGGVAVPDSWIPGTPFRLRMPAVCTSVPAGHSLGLGLSLYHPTYAAANTDAALRASISCGDSLLELPMLLE